MHTVLVAGDTKVKLVLHLKKATLNPETGEVATKVAFDLTGKTVDLRLKVAGSTAVKQGITIRSPATAGIAEYQPATGQEFGDGELVAEPIVKDADGKFITAFQPRTLRVRKVVA